jgi:hypothetical protein
MNEIVIMLAVVMGIMIILIAGDTTDVLDEIRTRYFRNMEQMLIAATQVKVSVRSTLF